MTRILNDFAELGELKRKLSREDVIPSAKKSQPSHVQRLQGNVYFDYNTYLEAAAAAVKAYPIIFVNNKKVQFTFSKKDRSIALGNNGHRFFFRYKMLSNKRAFEFRDRHDAFRAIMFIYLEVRKIAASHVLILENPPVSNFVLSINEIPLVVCSYKRFTGTFSLLGELKGQILRGDIKPKNEIEENAVQMGVKFREKVQDLSSLDGMEIIPENDYSVFKHEERIRVSTKHGIVEPNTVIKANKTPSKKVYPGRSLPAAPPKERPPEQWLVNKWADRYDHDD